MFPLTHYLTGVPAEIPLVQQKYRKKIRVNKKLTVWKEQNTPKIFLLLEEHSESMLVFIHTNKTSLLSIS